MPDAPKRETVRHREAFELYWAMGEKRSIAEVARQVQVSHHAVANWSVKFNWQQKLADRDARVCERISEKAAEQAVELRTRISSLCKATMARYAEQIRDGTVMPDVSDFVRVAQLELLLRGEPTSREEHNVNSKSVSVSLYHYVLEKIPENANNKSFLDLLRKQADPGPERPS